MEDVTFVEKARAVAWAYNYEKFLSSLQVWANTTFITRVRPLMIPETDGNLHRIQDVRIKNRNYNHITNKNENLLINRKLGIAGYQMESVSDWMEPSLYQDLINSLDERTRKHQQIKEDKYKADAERWGKSPIRPPVDHPLEQYLPSELRNNEWVDDQGKNLQMHKEDFTRDYLDIVATQKDSDYVGKSASAYLKTKPYSTPAWNLSEMRNSPDGIPQYMEYSNHKNAWGGFLDIWKPKLSTNPAAILCSQDERFFEGLSAIAEGAAMGVLNRNEIVGFMNEAYSIASEEENFPDLDQLLREMVFLLEIFELDQTVLELEEFEIESRYQSADIDEEGMRDLWHEAIKDNLSADESARFEEYPDEFEDDYPFEDFLSDKTWNDTEIVRTHGNRVRWVYDKNSPFLNYETDSQAQTYEIYAPSPFAKQYSPYLRGSPFAERDMAWRNDPAKNLAGMRWGDYAWVNVFPIGGVLGVNENPDTINSFVPIKFPNSLILVNKIAEETRNEPQYGEFYSPLESNIQLAAGYGLLDVTYSLARQTPSEPVLPPMSSDDGIYTDYNNIGDDYEDNSAELTQLLGWEDNVGLHDIFLALKIRFSNQPNRFINFVRRMPKKLLDSGTN